MSTAFSRLFHLAHFPRLRMLSAVALSTAALLATGCGGMSRYQQSALHSSDMPPAIHVNGIMIGTVSRMTLYTFDRDEHQVSHCLDECARKWPPLYAHENARARGDFGVITRPDGKKQWTLTGKPLYFYEKDVRPGDMLGDNARGLWHVFRPAHAPSHTVTP